MTRGGPGAAPGWAAGAEAAGHVTAPELAWAMRFTPRQITRRFACLAFCLDLKLVRGGTWSPGYRQTS
jgi:hypothetical protein